MTAYDIHFGGTTRAGDGAHAIGRWAVLDATGRYYVPGTAAARAAAGNNRGGVVRSAASNGEAIEVQFTGPVPASVTGLGAGDAAYVEVTATGGLQRNTTLTSAAVGTCDALGNMEVIPGIGLGGAGGVASFGGDIRVRGGNPALQDVHGVLGHVIDETATLGEEHALVYSAADGQWQLRRGTRIFNVRDYGAKGDYDPTTDTGTDDTLAFLACRDALQNAIAASSGRVSGRFYIPGGKYKITGRVAFCGVEGLLLHGDGASLSRIYWCRPRPAPLTLADGGATGTLIGGEYYVFVTHVNALGESPLSLVGAPITVAANHSITVTVPAGPSGTVSRKLYVTKHDDLTRVMLAATISDNTTTTYQITADADDTDFFAYHQDTPAIELQSCWHSEIAYLTVLAPEAYYCPEAIRMSHPLAYDTALPTGFGISTRNVMRRVTIGGTISNTCPGSIGVCVRFGSTYEAGNNDFHSIEDCTFTYYGDSAIAVENSQSVGHTLKQPLSQGGIAPSAVASITNGSAFITHGGVKFGPEDVGKYVEFWHNNGDGTLTFQHRAKIKRFVSATQLELDTVSPVTDAASIFVFGSQFGVRCAWGRTGYFTLSFGGDYSMYGGAFSTCLWASHYIGGYGGGAVSIYSASDEGSRCLLETSNNPLDDKGVSIHDMRWAADGMVSAQPFVIKWYFGGRLHVSNSLLGDPANPRDVRVAIGGFYGSNDHHKVVLFSNCSIGSTADTSLIFNGQPPNRVVNCRHHNSSTGEVFMLGDGRTAPFFFESGAFPATWGHAPTIIVGNVTGDTQVTLDPQGTPRGLSERSTLLMRKNGADSDITFTDTINWLTPTWQMAPGKWATYEVRRDIDGTFYALQLGSPLDARISERLAVNPAHTSFAAGTVLEDTYEASSSVAGTFSINGSDTNAVRDNALFRLPAGHNWGVTVEVYASGALDAKCVIDQQYKWNSGTSDFDEVYTAGGETSGILPSGAAIAGQLNPGVTSGGYMPISIDMAAPEGATMWRATVTAKRIG